jgi:hypothetical protein
MASIDETVLSYISKKCDRSLTPEEWAEAMSTEEDYFYRADYTAGQVRSALGRLVKTEDHLVAAVGTGKARKFHSTRFQG